MLKQNICLARSSNTKEVSGAQTAGIKTGKGDRRGIRAGDWERGKVGSGESLAEGKDFSGKSLADLSRVT